MEKNDHPRSRYVLHRKSRYSSILRQDAESHENCLKWSKHSQNVSSTHSQLEWHKLVTFYFAQTECLSDRFKLICILSCSLLMSIPKTLEFLQINNVNIEFATVFT